MHTRCPNNKAFMDALNYDGPRISSIKPVDTRPTDTRPVDQQFFSLFKTIGDLRKFDGIGQKPHPLQERKWDLSRLIDPKEMAKFYVSEKEQGASGVDYVGNDLSDMVDPRAIIQQAQRASITPEQLTGFEIENPRIIYKASHLRSNKELNKILHTLPIAIFEPQPGRKVIFLGSVHTPENHKNVIGQSIEKIMSEHKPDIVITEWLPTHLDTSPASFIAGAHYDVTSNKHPFLENKFIAHLADLQHIPVIGGEPSNDQLIKIAQSDHDIAEEVGALWWLGNTLESTYNKSESLTPKIFQKYIEAHYPESLNHLKTTPISLANQLQCYKRDPNLVTTILTASKEYPTVAVVYGAKHLDNQLPVLEQHLGPATIQTLKEFNEPKKAVGSASENN